tara:strand:+ start:1111 stop:1341 length:231 start_codon:yes stop_codon:yes gene_type:complete
MNRKERKTIIKSVQTIQDIGDKNLGSKIKKNWKNNIKGAIVGGGLGVIVAIAMRKNPVVLGILGLILGRIVFKFNK